MSDPTVIPAVLPDDFQALGMPALRALGEPLGLSFPPGTSKEQARTRIAHAHAKATRDADEPSDSGTDDFAALVAEAEALGIEGALRRTPSEELRRLIAEVKQTATPPAIVANLTTASGEAPGAPAKRGERLPITRTGPNAWWCPVCDHSQLSNVTTCGGCGAVRDGDEVTV